MLIIRISQLAIALALALVIALVLASRDLFLQVDPGSNATHLICRCNHLTSFGGNFIQAPNPIDFDKVFAEFGNLAESGNISVLVTICCSFLLYFVALVFARRADKKDENKVCCNIFSDNSPTINSCTYTKPNRSMNNWPIS